MALFERALQSVLELDSLDDVQANVLIIDNASPIAIESLLASRTTALVRVVRREQNNIGTARSQAVAMALEENFEWIAFVDADIELPSEWLMTLVREAQTLPMKDAVAIATVNRPPHENAFLRALDFLNSNQAMQMSASSRPDIFKAKVSYLPACAVLLHTKAVAHAGGFDADFSRVGDDLEMCYRLKRNGSLWILSAPVAFHRQDRNLEAWSKRMFRYGWGQIEVARVHIEHLQMKRVFPLLGMLGFTFALILLILGYSAPMKLLMVGYLGFVSAPIILRGISEGRMDVSFHACWISLVTDIAYSFGMLAGLLRIKRNPVISSLPEPSVIPRDGGR